MKDGIEQIWFDLEGTLTVRSPAYREVHDELRYNTFAGATHRPRSKELEQEFDTLYRQQGSNSAVFRSLGLPSDYWQHHFDTIDQAKFYSPTPEVYETVEKLKAIVHISLFTNSKPDNAMRTLKLVGVDKEWFTNIITGDDVKERKPALDGFRLMISKSALPASTLLFVGDRVGADIVPAKTLGMRTCLVWGESEEADYSFKNFQGLLSLIQ
jgi:FMN phosphatase YigB (HAD superfamily)